MKKLILFTIFSVSALFSSAQCSADFTWTTSGNTVQITNTSSGTNFHNWSFGDGAGSSATNPTHTYSAPGSYDICLYSYYQDSMGGFCDDSTCYLVTVMDSSGTGCTLSANIYDANGTIYGSNTSSGASSFEWTVHDYSTGAYLHTATTTDLFYSPGYTGDFWVCLIGFDASGSVCDSLCEVVVSVNSGGNGCSVSAGIYGWNGELVGNNTSSGASSYGWTVFDYNTGATLTNTSTYDLSYFPGYYGDFWVCLIGYDSLGFECDSLCEIITLMDSTSTGCVAGAQIYSNVNEIVGNNTSVGASSYEWSVWDYSTGASLTTVTTTDLSYYPNYTGNFWVCLTAYDSAGFVCDTICDVVTAVYDSTANVGVISFNDFKLYPNPTNAVINLQFDQLPTNAHARLVDLLGREMAQVDLTTQITEINVADFPSGIYLVQLIDANNQLIGTRKFVRE